MASCWLYIKSADKIFIALAVFVYASAFILRAFRWKILLAPLKVLAVIKLFSYLIFGFFMNSLLPFRLGELIRANITGQKTKIPRSGVLATVVVERLFDGLSYVVLFLLTILFLPFPELAKKSMLAASILFISGIVSLFFLVAHRETAIKLFHKIPLPLKIKNRMQSMFLNFIDGLSIFSQGSALIKVFALSLAVWTVEGSFYYILSIAFGLDLNLLQCFLVMIVIGTGAILPTAPGFVGTVEFLGVTSLAFLGINKNQAFGFIITMHFLQLLTIAILGIYAMAKEKISITELINFKNSKPE